MLRTDYEVGIENGKDKERKAILEYIEYHPDCTIQDIIDEIEGRYRQDMNALLAAMPWN